MSKPLKNLAATESWSQRESIDLLIWLGRKVDLGENAEMKAASLFLALVPGTLSAQNEDLFTSESILYIEEKLTRIILPEIDFEETPFFEGLDFLRVRSVALDDFEPDPAKKGINFVILAGAQEQIEAAGGKLNITMKVNYVPVQFAVEYFAKLGGLRWAIHPHAVLIGTEAEIEAELRKLRPDDRQNPDLAYQIEKLERMILPELKFDRVPFSEAISSLRKISIEMDELHEDQWWNGVNIVFLREAQLAIQAGDDEPRITLDLENPSLGAALRYVSAAAGFRLDVHPEGVAIGTAEELEAIREDLGLELPEA